MEGSNTLNLCTNEFDSFCNALSNVKPKVLFCERFDEKSSIWNFEDHKHDCIELLYFLYGNAEVTAEENIVQASFYDIVIYPQGVYHTEHLQMNHHQEIFCVWVDIPGLRLDDVIHIQDKDSSIKWVLEKLHEEYKSSNPSVPLIEHYIKLATMLIAKVCFEKRGEDAPLRRIIVYMQSNMSQVITVEELAELIYVSKSYLSRFFKQKTGMSLIEYLRLIRINAAKKLLVSTNTCIEEISCVIGYNSPKYFCRAFRKCTGMTPSEYRKNEKQKTTLKEADNYINI